MSTSDKLSYLVTTKSKLKTAINYTGANITNDTFRSYPEKLYNAYINIINQGTQDLFDSLPKVSGTGSNITLNNTASAPMVLDYNGDTQQDSTTGKNLFDINNIIKNKFINDQNYEATNNFWNRSDYINVDSNSTYAWSAISNVSDTKQLAIIEYNSSKNMVKYNWYSQDNIQNPIKTVTLSSNTAYVIVQYRNDKNLTELQFEKNNTRTSYEPYSGRYASPSPNWQQPINVVTGRQELEICGKNVLNVSNDNVYINALNNPDITTTYNQNKTTYKVNSLPQQYSQAGYYYAFHTRIGETYKVKVKWENTNGTPIANVRIMGNTGETIIVNNMTSNTEYTFIASQETYYFRVWVSTNIGEGYIENPIISTIDTSYEAYTRYTQEINLGKNLFDKDNANILNGYLADGGTLVSNSGYRTLYISCNQNTTYTISKIQSNYFRVAEFTSIPLFGDSYITRTKNDSATSITFTTTTGNYLAITYLSPSDTLTEQQILDTIQIEKGSQASSYSAYFTPIELWKIENQDHTIKYQDRIFFNEPSSPYYNNQLESYKWFLHKEINKVVLDGSESWTLTQTSNVFYTPLSGYLKTEGITSICNYYKSVDNVNGAGQQSSRGNNTISLYRNDGNNRIYLRDDNQSSASNLQTWLSTHNTSFYYALATSADTEITYSALLTQLELFRAEKSKSGQTNFMITSDDLPAILNASAIKEYE